MELLAQIDKANKDLRGFTHQGRILEPVRYKRRSKPNAAYFKELRMNARSLYSVIVGGGAWTCTCRSRHVANLRLELRPKGVLKTTFRVLLTSGIQQSASGNATSRGIWTWREVDVAPLPEPGKIPSAANIAPLPTASTLVALRKSSRLGKVTPWARGANFASEAPMSEPASSRASTHQRFITDLCNAIEPDSSNEIIGVLVDDHSSRKHDISIAGQGLPAHYQINLESLDSLLKVSHNQPSKFYLSRRDRLRIAVTLASSVLQLDRTSWLRPRWRSADILFVKHANTDFRQPYISSRICVDTLDTNAEQHIPGQAADETAYLIHNNILFALGITLIELAFGKPLAKMQHAEDVQSNETLTSIRSSHRLLDSVYNESGGRYGDVVRRCLHCSFDYKDKTFENDEFQEAVVEWVVTPLMQDLEAFEGCAPNREV